MPARACAIPGCKYAHNRQKELGGHRVIFAFRDGGNEGNFQKSSFMNTQGILRTSFRKTRFLEQL